MSDIEKKTDFRGGSITEHADGSTSLKHSIVNAEIDSDGDVRIRGVTIKRIALDRCGFARN